MLPPRPGADQPSGPAGRTIIPGPQPPLVEAGDEVLRGQRTIAWHAGATGGADGLAFAVSGDQVTVTLLIDGRLASPEQIGLGTGQVRAPSNPVTLERGRP